MTFQRTVATLSLCLMAGMAMALGGPIAGCQRGQSPPEGPAAAPAEAAVRSLDRPTVAVLPFTNSTGRATYDDLAAQMGDFLAAALQASDRLTCVDRSALRKVLAEWKLALGAAPAPADRQRVGRALGARFLITGGIALAEGRLKITAHLLEVESGRVLRSAEAEGTFDELLPLLQQVAATLTELPIQPTRQADGAPAARSPQAQLHLARGLGYYYAGMFDFATGEFMKALAMTPQYAEARYWNARCYAEGGEPEHARVECRRFLADHPQDPLAGKVNDLLTRLDAPPDRGPGGRTDTTQ